jgi:SnoaL-like domain
MKSIRKLYLLAALLCACTATGQAQLKHRTPATANARTQIAALLDSFNVFAAKADFTNYFNCFAENGVFIGTDATENWNKQNFMTWAKPYFDRKTTWNFKSLERHIFFDKKGNTAWFDELLDTQMKICRGSGVLTKQGRNWKIEQYVLSVTVPNSIVDSVVAMKAPIEEGMIKRLKEQ